MSSQPPNDTQFVRILKVMITGAKLVAPMVVLPAVSVPALSAFSEAFGYWEDRTRFVMNGNLTTAVATQQALADPTREDSYIGLLNGDYVMVAKEEHDPACQGVARSRLSSGLSRPPRTQLERTRATPWKLEQMLPCRAFLIPP